MTEFKYNNKYKDQLLQWVSHYFIGFNVSMDRQKQDVVLPMDTETDHVLTLQKVSHSFISKS